MNIEIQTILNSQCVFFIWENNTKISEYDLMRNNPPHRSLVSSITCMTVPYAAQASSAKKFDKKVAQVLPKVAQTKSSHPQ